MKARKYKIIGYHFGQPGNESSPLRSRTESTVMVCRLGGGWTCSTLALCSVE